MASYYSDIFEVLQQLERERENRKHFLKRIPEVRAQLYQNHLFPEKETFMPQEWIDGSIILVPGNQTLFIYRGQVQDFPSCVPKIYRGELTIYDLFEARLKQREFERVIQTHPAVQDIIKYGIHISFTGLAQHYGFRTEFLDVTSDPMVAAFFAVCHHSKAAEKYLPIVEQDELGVFMKTPSIVYNITNPTNVPKLQPIGLQPFPRPGNQKAYTVQLESREDYSAHKMLFHQTKKSSEYIYDMFEGGGKLFPADPIKDKAKEILGGKIFSREVSVDICSRYKFPLKPEFYVDELNFEIVSSSPYEFTSEELTQFQEEWENGGKATFKKQIGPTYLAYT
ncbi:MAG: hypothetical protein DDT30_00885 [Dehalococcoidia bacterium]|nr:hypothetical protein [Bacillota bacterium]MBT9160346.1 hypothetical protein [Chloroflexota bacterium]MBT9161694.1 hypothetical protein [Chloroflexota bacterium]